MNAVISTGHTLFNQIVTVTDKPIKHIADNPKISFLAMGALALCILPTTEAGPIAWAACIAACEAAAAAATIATGGAAGPSLIACVTACGPLLALPFPP